MNRKAAAAIVLIMTAPWSLAAIGPPAATGPARARKATTQPARRNLTMEMVGKVAPAFSLRSVEGRPVGTSELAGAPATVFNFVAPNCPFCKRQLPTMEQVREKYESRGVRFINVMQTLHGAHFTPKQMSDVMNRIGAMLEIAPDDGNKIGVLYKVMSLPTTVVVRPNGVIAWVGAGVAGSTSAALSQTLDRLLQEEATGTRPSTAAPTSQKAAAR